MLKRIFTCCFIILVLTACVPATATPHPVSTLPPTRIPTPKTEQSAWWQDAVFYEIFVRSFYDTDENGIGDFNGITAKLDYLNDNNPSTSTDLGITGSGHLCAGRDG